ncbi:MAG TPA: DUF58 domain-containing protein [Pseudobacteroides sp.]|uniref:DUF58 domain-containing protein n=1 Tax=Pseudobacteroides sp. TaxID=1968840 RepID=UPI002F93E7E4
MIEVISNHKLIPIVWLQLESEITPYLQFKNQANLDIRHQQFHRSYFSLLPFTKITRKHTVKCSKRGFYTLKSAVLSCNDAFNRDYQYGDSMNRINWKSTARTSNIKVHNTDCTSNIKIIILLNIQSMKNSWDDNTDMGLMEKAVSYCASITNHMISQGIDTGFCCNCYSSQDIKKPVLIPAGAGCGHVNLLLESIAVMELKKTIPFHSLLDDLSDSFAKNADFLAITSYVNNHMKKSIQRIKDLGCKVEILNLC